MSSAPVRLILADDHPPTRVGVRAALEKGGFEVLAAVADGEAAVEAVRRYSPDLALLDVNMPGNGITAAWRISRDFPEVVIVMLTVSGDDDDLFTALRSGASGYLLKDIDPERLPLALRGVLSGEAALPRTLVSKLIDEFRIRSKRRLPGLKGREVRLSEREWEVLEMMGDGLTTAEMARRMFVASVTVRSHVAAILRKLRVPDRAAAVDVFRRQP